MGATGGAISVIVQSVQRQNPNGRFDTWNAKLPDTLNTLDLIRASEALWVVTDQDALFVQGWLPQDERILQVRDQGRTFLPIVYTGPTIDLTDFVAANPDVEAVWRWDGANKAWLPFFPGLPAAFQGIRVLKPFDSAILSVSGPGQLRIAPTPCTGPTIDPTDIPQDLGLNAPADAVTNAVRIERTPDSGPRCSLLTNRAFLNALILHSSETNAALAGAQPGDEIVLENGGRVLISPNPSPAQVDRVPDALTRIGTSSLMNDPVWGILCANPIFGISSFGVSLE